MDRITISNGRWFDQDSAITFDGARFWNGSNHICMNGEGQWGGQKLFFTKSGNWVLHRWSNGNESYDQIEESDAVQWLVDNLEYEPEGLPKQVFESVIKQIASLEA